MTTALFLGRFQPFHNGHLYVIKEALKEADKIVIGVAYNDKADRNENPFSVKERIEMIDLALPANEIGDYTIFPVPDNEDDSKWVEELETLLPKFDVVYMSDKNTFGEKWVERCLKEKYTIRRIKSITGIDGTIIREKIKNKEEWKSLVPSQVAVYITKLMHLRE
ncbi:adenylyltransferase/cytidyltransferase family protein [Candidatus Woesearchaeota archaeon]|nr:adenylyltransferase/cytidyltransferase family protein [Candidatus Woesearchaeota archaeon]